MMATGREEKLCELCEERVTTALCSECCKCYCDECNAYVHKKGSKKYGHKIETIPKGMRVDAMCPVHKNNPFEMFCVDDMRLSCGICGLVGSHKDHRMAKLSDISRDNEIFSAAKVRGHFEDVLKYDDELDKKIALTIENIRNESSAAKEAVSNTFKKAHEQLNREEAAVIGEIERVRGEGETSLKKALDVLKDVREYSVVLNDASIKTQGQCSRFMELSIVSEMERQRRAMEEVHKMMMTDLKIKWDDEKRKLSFVRSLVNGAPVPQDISFPTVTCRKIEMSWNVNKDMLESEDAKDLKYTVEMKKSCGDNEEEEWKEVYSGEDSGCVVDDLEMDTEYNVRVKSAVRDFNGMWSNVACVRTKKLFVDSLCLSQEFGKEQFYQKLSEWCGTYNFELLYRGSRDGFGASTFHKRCDHQGKTLTIVKNSSGHIFGGFATIPWRNPSTYEFKQAPGSFLFTLTNMHGTQPTKIILKSEKAENAVCHNNSHGPAFGGGHDLRISSECNTNQDSYANFPFAYSDATGRGSSIFSSNESTYNFQVREIEVFKVDV